MPNAVLTMLGSVITKLPFEKWLVRPREPKSDAEILQEILSSGRQGPAPAPAAAEPPRRLPGPTVASKAPAAAKETGPSESETKDYQNDMIIRELAKLQLHLSQGCLIANKPCDCCYGKHAPLLAGLAQETFAMWPEPIYQELAEWAEHIAIISTPAQIASGKNNLAAEAVKAREFRKRLVKEKE